MLRLRGRRPTNLGVAHGRFSAPPTGKPNWVSSQVDGADPHYIAPLRFEGDAKAAMQRLTDVIAKMPRVEIKEARDDYLGAEFSTPLMGFVDDVEFYTDGTVIHARSASRLGARDFGVNRRRIEAIREAFAVPGRAGLTD
jgi:uncharacterized protein (DUF1499 family)